MDRFRRKSRVSSASKNLRTLDTTTENEIHRNCLQLLFSANFTPEGDHRSVLDCLRHNDFDAIDFEKLNTEISLSETIHGNPDSAETKIKNLLAQVIFQYLTYHRVSFDDLYKFIEKMVRFETTKFVTNKQQPFRSLSLAKPLFFLTSMHIHSFSIEVSIEFARNIWAYFFHLAKQHHVINHSNHEDHKKIKDNINFFCRSVEISNFLPEEIKSLFLYDIDPNKTSTHTQDQSNSSTPNEDALSQQIITLLKDEAYFEEGHRAIELPELESKWRAYQTDQAKRLLPIDLTTHSGFFFMTSSAISDQSPDQKSEITDPITASLQNAWQLLQQQKILLLRQVEQLPPSLKEILEPLQSRLKEAIQTETPCYGHSALQLLREFIKQYPEQYSAIDENTLSELLLALEGQFDPLTQLSEVESSVLLFSSGFTYPLPTDQKSTPTESSHTASTHPPTIITCLEQGQFDQLDFDQLDQRTIFVTRNIDHATALCIYRYLIHHQVNFTYFNEFVCRLTQCNAAQKYLFLQPCLTGDLFFKCLTHTRSYSDDLAIQFVVHAFYQLFKNSDREIQWIGRQDFNRIYARFMLSPMLTNEDKRFFSPDKEHLFYQKTVQLWTLTNSHFQIIEEHWQTHQAEQAKALTAKIKSIKESWEHCKQALLTQVTDELTRKESKYNRRHSTHSNDVEQAPALCQPTKYNALLQLKALAEQAMGETRLSARSVLIKFRHEQPDHYQTLLPPSKVLTRLCQAASTATVTSSVRRWAHRRQRTFGSLSAIFSSATASDDSSTGNSSHTTSVSPPQTPTLSPIASTSAPPSPLHLGAGRYRSSAFSTTTTSADFLSVSAPNTPTRKIKK